MFKRILFSAVLLPLVFAAAAVPPASSTAPATAPAMKDWNAGIASAIAALEKSSRATIPLSSTAIQWADFNAKKDQLMKDTTICFLTAPAIPATFIVDNVFPADPASPRAYRVTGHIDGTYPAIGGDRRNASTLTINTNNSSVKTWKGGDKKTVTATCTLAQFSQYSMPSKQVVTGRGQSTKIQTVPGNQYYRAILVLQAD